MAVMYDIMSALIPKTLSPFPVSDEEELSRLRSSFLKRKYLRFMRYYQRVIEVTSSISA